jgi:hypothetical protein
MSYQEDKNKISIKVTSSQNSINEESNKTKSLSKGKSIPDKVYQNSIENLKNMSELKQNLKKGDYCEDFKKGLLEFQEENEEISELYANEEKMDRIIQEESDWKLNNDLFEERALEILSDVYELKEYNLYPYFDVGYSKTKKSNVIKIYFNQIELNVENEESSFSALFLSEKDTYMFKFQEMPMILHKYNEDFYSLTVITKDFKNSIDFEFTKGDKNERISTTSFIFAEINEDLIETKNKIKELKNGKDSIDDKTKKAKIDKKIESYKKILKSKEKLYSKKNIENELEKKRNELIILEENAKLKEIDDIEEGEIKKEEKEEEEKITKLKEEINNYKNSLKKIILKIEQKDKEIDGLYFTSKKIILKNTIGDVLTIPEKRAVIVEVKNIKKYQTIVENIRSKKKLMNTLGIKTEALYFVGILRGININQEQKEKINKTIFKDLNMKNMIIIYPEKLNFLNVPLIEVKNGVKEGQKSDINLYDIINELKNELKELTGQINELRKDVNFLKEKIK